MKLSTTISLVFTLFTLSTQAQHDEILEGELEPRQAKDYNQDASAAAAQAPAVTTIYMQASVGNTVTYKPFTVTQTFAKVPDQWPTPASGVIGYGTLTKRDEEEKREAEPTGGAVPLVMEMESVGMMSWIQPVVAYTEVRYEAVWVSAGNPIHPTVLSNQTVTSNMVGTAATATSTG